MSHGWIPGRRLGWVADFCAICREIRPTRLSSALSSAGQSAESLRGLECGTCGFVRWTESTRFIAALPAPAEDLDTLIARTHPDVRELYAGRLDIEELIKDGRLSPEDRGHAIREPLELLAPGIVDPPGAAWVGVVVVTGVALCLGLFVLGSALRRPPAWIPVAAISGLLVSLVTVVLFGFLGPVWKPLYRRRHLRRSIFPKLARCLRPLNPSLEELRSTLEGMRSLGIPAARYVEPELLHREIQRSRGLD